jgi:hypothetical protein
MKYLVWDGIFLPENTVGDCALMSESGDDQTARKPELMATHEMNATQRAIVA